MQLDITTFVLKELDLNISFQQLNKIKEYYNSKELDHISNNWFVHFNFNNSDYKLVHKALKNRSIKYSTTTNGSFTYFFISDDEVSRYIRFKLNSL